MSVQKYLENGINPNRRWLEKSGYGRTALIRAIEHGYTEIVDLLLTYHADPNQLGADPRGADRLPLEIACKTGYSDILTLLLEHGANIDLPTAYATNYLWWSPFRIRMTDDSQTLLHIAALNGHATTVRTLFSYFKNLDVQNRRGKTALLMAAEQGYEEIVELLWQHGANINVQDESGKTALMYAVEIEDAEIRRRFVKFLLQQGADPSLKDKKGRTVLKYAEKAENQEIIALFQNNHLLSSPENVERLTKKAIHALDYTAMIDSKGYLHLVAIDRGMFEDELKLMYITNEQGIWSEHIIDRNSTLLQTLSIMIDVQDHVHIFYYDEKDGLVYATNTTQGWEIKRLEKALQTQSQYLSKPIIPFACTISSQGHIYSHPKSVVTCS